MTVIDEKLGSVEYQVCHPSTPRAKRSLAALSRPKRTGKWWCLISPLGQQPEAGRQGFDSRIVDTDWMAGAGAEDAHAGVYSAAGPVITGG